MFNSSNIWTDLLHTIYMLHQEVETQNIFKRLVFQLHSTQFIQHFKTLHVCVIGIMVKMQVLSQVRKSDPAILDI